MYSKLLDYIIFNMIESKLETEDVQFAYKNSFSTSMCSFLVIETIEYYRSRGSNVFTLLLDATKAFDRVQYSKLFKMLINRGVCMLVVRLQINMYLVNCAVIGWNSDVSSEFEVKNGVKQGGVLSPHFFGIYTPFLI